MKPFEIFHTFQTGRFRVTAFVGEVHKDFFVAPEGRSAPEAQPDWRPLRGHDTYFPITGAELIVYLPLPARVIGGTRHLFPNTARRLFCQIKLPACYGSYMHKSISPTH